MHRIALMFETGLNTREASKKKQIYPPTPPQKKCQDVFQALKNELSSFNVFCVNFLFQSPSPGLELRS